MRALRVYKVEEECARGALNGAETDGAVDVESMLSAEGQARQMAGLRKIVTAFAGVPGIIGLHGGLPPASSFPIKGVTLTLGNGQKVEIEDPIKVRTLSSPRHAAALSKLVLPSHHTPVFGWLPEALPHPCTCLVPWSMSPCRVTLGKLPSFRLEWGHAKFA